MGLNIRKATPYDAPAWRELLCAITENEYPDKQVYAPAWIAAQLQEPEAETWVAEENGTIYSTLSFLAPSSESSNPVANIGRHLNRAESYDNGAAGALMARAVELAEERKQLLISRVIGSDIEQQRLYEKAGFCPVGFQPFKHSHRVRESALFYYRLGGHNIHSRLPISESLPQVAELAELVLGSLNIPCPPAVRNGITGYPLQSELQFADVTRDEFDLWRIKAQAGPFAVEISGAYNHGIGFLRTAAADQTVGLLAMSEERVTAGLLYFSDPVDRCIRLIDSFSTDDLSLGPLLNELVKRAQRNQSALYLEMDVLATAQRLLKSTEQLGFIPVAYLPAVYWKAGSYADVIKLVKLNSAYAWKNVSLSPDAKKVGEVIDRSFQDQKMGLGIINLLRGLPFFESLGDGELRKIARLFVQKLYRPGEKIFHKGDSSDEAYVVMRGQVDILLEESMLPVAQFGTGQIFGELAFLDGTPRAAIAIATQASILLVIQRVAFNTLVQHEPHLGMVVMRNIALELSKRLRKSNELLPSAR